MTEMREPDVARLYHLHSSNLREQVPDLTVDHDRPPARFARRGSGPRVPLVAATPDLRQPLGEALVGRRSVREFADGELALESLGALLGGAAGLHGWREVDGEDVGARPYPSAGGRYPLEVNVATRGVSGVPDGVHRYDARAHELEQRREGSVQEALADMTIGQAMIAETNAVFCISAFFDRTMWKYGQRGYRYVWLDAGHLGQNVYLVAGALGLGAVAVGGFYDEEVRDLLALEVDERPIYLVAVGIPAPEA